MIAMLAGATVMIVIMTGTKARNANRASAIRRRHRISKPRRKAGFFVPALGMTPSEKFYIINACGCRLKAISYIF